MLSYTYMVLSTCEINSKEISLMTFYMRPPRGFANVKNLEDTVRQRLACYSYLFSDNVQHGILELDCLVEDTVLDRLGHYLFRLASLNSNLFYDDFIRNEVKLLDIRLGYYSSTDVKYVIRKLKKQANDSSQTIKTDGRLEHFYSVLIRICLQLLRKRYFDHAFTSHNEICEKCSDFNFKVPFELCLDLVASREYDIRNGFVYIYCFQWKQLLLSLYKTYLTLVLKEMRASSKVRFILEDDRIKDVLLLAEHLLSARKFDKTGHKRGTFKLTSIQQEFKKFPPCMRHLYEVLQKKNRLSHNARFDFSLYLKGIGLPLEDAFVFWEHMYSKPHTSCSRCTHSWQDNEKRYIYGIRHLYGLEGSRKNYNIKSCQQMQDTSLTVCDEGRCPFRHFDDEHLRKMLKDYLQLHSHDQIEVIMYERRQNSKKGCELFFTEYLNNVYQKGVEESKVNFQDPVQYYLLANEFS